LDRASVGCRAHVRGDAAAERGDRLDAAAERNFLAARTPLYGRDLRLLSADGESTFQAADAHLAQAGARLWRWRGARDAESRGPGLQGPRQHRHVADRSPADRARPRAAARWPRYR